MTQIFRVTVRGRFADLDDEARSRLRERLAATSDLPGFSEAGQLHFDARLDFFSFRVQVRERSDDGEDRRDAAFDQATARCLGALDDLGVAHRDLKVVGSDLASVWNP
jgi:hypothetical protein